jgi:hypothetical protein
MVMADTKLKMKVKGTNNVMKSSAGLGVLVCS